ncbi:MAG TPA: ribosome maturation factor RimM [Xanthobacteraceae bacterium]|nr:ribosome maturation factor RimM [Xanthobacteraceae bacterium]
MKNRICVARIGGAHGTRGEVRLWPFTAPAEAVKAYGPLETADRTCAFEIETLRPAKDFFVARLKGVTDRTAAERLCNTELYVPRDRLPPPAPDEFYHADLIGLEALDAAGEVIGVVIAVHNFGAGDLLEIAPAAGGETVMLPFSTSTVPSIEIATGRIIVDLPKGLLAPDSPEAGAPCSVPGGGGNTDR